MSNSTPKPFEDYLIPEPMSGCWLWIGGARKKKGGDRPVYGVGASVSVLAHRHSYERYKGEIPKGMKVLHKCDNTMCVNPDHLYVGTQKDNMQDYSLKKQGLRSPMGSGR